MLGSGPVAQSIGSDSHTFLIVGNRMDLVPVDSRAVLVATFTSYEALNFALTHGRISPRIKAVLYDNENWSLTPKYEQQNLAKYEVLAEEAAHARGLMLISTPAVNLVTELDPGPGTTFSKYLQLGIAATAARYSDVIDLQAQGSQLDPSKYIQFVAAATAQARAANPNVVVLAGLSTNPRGAPIPLSNLVQIVDQTRSTLDGYWLNIPVPGPSCPYCDQPQPGLAVQLLEMVGVNNT